MTARERAHRAVTASRQHARGRFSLPALCATLVGVSCLLLSATTPAITNTTSTKVSSAALMLQEHGNGHTCTSDTSSLVSLDASTCAAVNELGSGTAMIPGQPVVNSVTITNLGTVDARTIALTPVGACTQSWSPTVADLCSHITVVITTSGTTVFAGTAADFSHASAGQLRMPKAPNAHQHVQFTFTATLDPRVGNDYMGLEARVPVRWTLTA